MYKRTDINTTTVMVLWTKKMGIGRTALLGDWREWQSNSKGGSSNNGYIERYEAKDSASIDVNARPLTALAIE